MRTCSLAAAAILVCAAPLGAQSVAGTVVDRASRRPVPAAVITVLSHAGRRVGQASTDSAGRFTLPLNGGGGYKLHAQRIGYWPVTSVAFDVGVREALDVDLQMSTSAVALDALTITSRAEPPRVRHLESAGFYERERNGPGLFMRREDVARNGGTLMSDVLGRLPGARKGTLQGRPVISLARGSGGRMCAPAIFMDGLPVIRADVIDDVVHVAAVEAVEVYRGPSQTPARFAGVETGCGVVVIWTQRRVN